jgi:hypothetical protein
MEVSSLEQFSNLGQVSKWKSPSKALEQPVVQPLSNNCFDRKNEEEANLHVKMT